MTFFSSTPVECTLHPKLWKDNFTSDDTIDDDDEEVDFIPLPQSENGTEYVIFFSSTIFITQINLY